MNEAFGDLWRLEADLRVITTNGATRRSDEAAVMGRGCAYEAKKRFPGIEFRLGELLREHGNRVMRLAKLSDGSHLATFPVKRHWKEQADPALIRRSAQQLVSLVEKFGYERVVLPRPGCGNGRLSWAEVRPILAEVLHGERFTVVTFPPRTGTLQATRQDTRNRSQSPSSQSPSNTHKKRYVFFGSRSWNETTPIRERLAMLPEDATIVVGGARGADEITEKVARRMGFRVEVYPARWDQQGKGAGYRRNQRMRDLPGVVGAFGFRMPGRSAGTDHMAGICKQAGIDTTVQLPSKPPASHCAPPIS